jgi:hypothetical protein
MNFLDVARLVLAQAVITMFAMAVAYIKLRQDFRQYRARQLFEARLDRLRRQLSEFYGIHMLSVANSTVAKVAWGTDVWDRVWRDILIPANLKIEEILLSKIELLDEDAIPESFLAFMTHARVARSYRETGMRFEYFEKGTGYPVEFNDAIAAAYKRIRNRYQDAIKQSYTESH